MDLSALNKEQLLPVLDTQGAVLVTAGAGSGKTRLLTHRIAHLIIDENVPAYNILAITFTNKAAREMKERISQMVPLEQNIFISTFHAMCVRILRRFIDKIGYQRNFSIYDEQDRKRLLKAVAAKVDAHDDNLAASIGIGLSRIKNDGIDISEYEIKYNYLPEIHNIVEGMHLYQEEMRRRNALDFDDLLVVTYQLLLQNQQAREHYQQRFEYIHVDEFQDTNIIQYQLVKILGGKHGNIFVVGDEDQSIYGWRGANIKNIQDFIKDFDCKVYKLEQNYRSSKKILCVANAVIENNSARIKKELWTQNDEGMSPQLFVANSDGDEADFVMQTVRGLKQQGHDYNDMAILMRVNALSRSIEQKFMFYGVPYKLYGGFKFYDRKEIKDLIAYLKLLVNPKDNEAAMRVLSFPKKGIGEVSLQKMLAMGSKHSLSLYDVIMSSQGINLEDSDIISYLGTALTSKLQRLAAQLIRLEENKHFKVSLFLKYLCNLLDVDQIYNADTEENESRLLNIKELVNSVIQTEEKNPDMSLEDYVLQIMLLSDLDGEPEGDSVSLFTVHSAKGLEFDTIFIIGAEDGIFPLARSIDTKNELEEERRLMYVAMTRAKKRLFISHTRTRFMYGRYNASIPSRFLYEAGMIKKIKARPIPAKTDRAAFTPIPTNLPSSSVDINDLKEGIKIRHKRLGTGIIKSVNYDAGEADVQFDSMGILTLNIAFAPIKISD